MSKLKCTRKDLRFDNCIAVGYCSLSSLLAYQDPIAYNSGIYGWNYDVYKFPFITITTGYRNMVGVSIDYDIIEKYEKQAKKNIGDKEKVNKLLSDFIQEVYNTYFN